MTHMMKTAITGASFATVLSLAMAHTAAADPAWTPAESGLRSVQTDTVARAPAGDTILVPTTDTATMTCDRAMLENNAPLVSQILGGSADPLLDPAIADRIGNRSDNLSATAGGVLIGVLAREPVTDRVAPADAACAQYAMASARNGQTVSWVSPDYGQHFSFTARDSYAIPGLDYCREYTGQSFANGKTTTMVGTVCQRPNGQWKVVN